MDIPIVTVVTDLAKPHLGWYHPRVDRCLVPCEPAYRRALAAGVAQEKLRIVGHPAHPKFALYKTGKKEARRAIGWDADVPTVLLLGGGDGMGKIGEIARAIDASRSNVHLAVVCGRNKALEERLKSARWHGPTSIYGFVNNMEVMMRASDLLITKAGPGTIAEAAIMGIPLILYGAIPLQETPNARYVVENGAGLYIKRPQHIAQLVKRVFKPNDDTLLRLSIGVNRIAHPDASFNIADEISNVAVHTRVSI